MRLQICLSSWIYKQGTICVCHSLLCLRCQRCWCGNSRRVHDGVRTVMDVLYIFANKSIRTGHRAKHERQVGPFLIIFGMMSVNGCLWNIRARSMLNATMLTPMTMLPVGSDNNVEKMANMEFNPSILMRSLNDCFFALGRKTPIVSATIESNSKSILVHQRKEDPTTAGGDRLVRKRPQAPSIAAWQWIRNIWFAL